MRPFERIENNIIELTNEGFLLVIIFILFMFNNSEKWSTRNTTMFLNILMINVLLIVTVIMSKNNIINYSYSDNYNNQVLCWKTSKGE